MPSSSRVRRQPILEEQSITRGGGLFKLVRAVATSGEHVRKSARNSAAFLERRCRPKKGELYVMRPDDAGKTTPPSYSAGRNRLAAAQTGMGPLHGRGGGHFLRLAPLSLPGKCCGALRGLIPTGAFNNLVGARGKSFVRQCVRRPGARSSPGHHSETSRRPDAGPAREDRDHVSPRLHLTSTRLWMCWPSGHSGASTATAGPAVLSSLLYVSQCVLFLCLRVECELRVMPCPARLWVFVRDLVALSRGVALVRSQFCSGHSFNRTSAWTPSTARS